MEDTGSLDESSKAIPSTMARDKQIVCQSENLCTKEDDTSTFFIVMTTFPSLSAHTSQGMENVPITRAASTTTLMKLPKSA